MKKPLGRWNYRKTIVENSIAVKQKKNIAESL